jgi:hypothetical protein
MKKAIISLFAILVLSCQNNLNNNQSDINDEIIFEIEKTNHAWGFVYQGTVINQEGKVYTYNPAKETDSILYNIDNYYSDKELTLKYSYQKTYIKTIQKDSILWANELSKKVEINNYSDTTGNVADMGKLQYSVYIYNKDKLKYQQILLRIEGDFNYYNKSESAVALVAWMKKL